MAGKKSSKGREPEPKEGDAEGKSAPEGELDYQVGYGKPPLDKRFGKGNKAGKGRKAGCRNLGTIVNEAANLKMPVKIGGKVRKLTRTELTFHQLSNKAASGDLKAADKYLFYVERYEPREDPADPTPEQLAPDIETLRDYLAFFDMINSTDDEDEDEDRDEAA